MKNILVVFTLITLMFSCEEKLKEGEYYETITIGNDYAHPTVKVIQIDTVYERSGDRYVGGWVNHPLWAGPYGQGAHIRYEGGGMKGKRDTRGFQGVAWYWDNDGDTTFKGQFIDGKKHGRGVETRISRGYSWSQYIGEFKWGKKHGKGILTFSDGRIRDGLWEWGHFLGEETFDIELSKSKVVPQSVQELCVLEMNLENKIIR